MGVLRTSKYSVHVHVLDTTCLAFITHTLRRPSVLPAAVNRIIKIKEVFYDTNLAMQTGHDYTHVVRCQRRCTRYKYLQSSRLMGARFYYAG